MGGLLPFLRGESAYRRLLTASLISGIGDAFNNVTVLSLLLDYTGTGLAVSLVLALRTIPYMVMGPVGGVLADRYDRKYILIVSDVARSILALSLLLVGSKSELWIAYVATVGLVMFSAIFAPARMSLIPHLVRPENLKYATSIEQSVTGLVMAIGSAFGGFLTSAFGAEVAFIVNAISFLVSGLICWSICVPKLAAQPERTNFGTGGDEPQTTGQEVPSLWFLFRTSRFVKIVTLQAFLWPLGGGVINVLISVYGFQEFQQGNVGVGILYGALGVGFFLSGLFAHRFSKWIVRALIIGGVIEGVGHILVSQSPNLWVASLLLLLATLGAGVGNASHDSLVMRLVPREVHGRTFALFGTASNVMIALSMLAAGALLEYVPARTLGLAGGLLIVCSALTGLTFLRIKVADINLGINGKAADNSA